MLVFAALTASVLNVNASVLGNIDKQSKEKGETKTDTASISLQAANVVSTRAGKRTPMAFRNVAKREIESVNYGKDIPSVLMFTPSITTTSDAGNGIGYSSFRVRGTDPSRINITANGIPLNDAESSTVFFTNMGDFASSVENIQIQRGVGTSTNGSGAFGATVNMQTEKIGSKPYASVDVSGGSYASHKETFRFGTGLLHNHWGFQGRLSNIGSDGYIDRASTRLDSYFLQGGYFSDNTIVKFVTFNGKEKTYHAWNYPSAYEMSLYGRRYNSCGEYYDSEGNVHYYKDQSDFYHQQHYQLLLTQMLGNALTLNAALHYTRGDGYYEEYKANKNLQDYGLSTEKMKTDLIRRKQMGNDFYGAIASIDYDNKKNLTATLGGGWNKYDGDHFGNVIWTKKDADVEIFPNFEYYRNNTQKKDFNVYGKVNYEFLKGLSVFADLQYRGVKVKMQDPSDYYLGSSFNGAYVINETYNFFNPKFGLNYNFASNNTLYASYGISHKEPVRNNFQAEFAVGNKMPKAERLNDLEVGYKYESSTFSVGANFYYMNYKDQFVLTGELDDIGEAVTRNLDKSYRMGVELSAAWQPVSWFKWDANATLSRNRVKDMAVTLTDGGNYTIKGDTPLAFSPDFIFNNIFSLNYKGFKASLMSQYVSKQHLTNTGFDYYIAEGENGEQTPVSMLIDSHFITNLDLSYSFKLRGVKSVTLGCTIYNLFSEKYFNNGWSAPSYKKNANGELVAYTTPDAGQYCTGYAASAPINVMAHVSINF